MVVAKHLNHNHVYLTGHTFGLLLLWWSNDNNKIKSFDNFKSYILHRITEQKSILFSIPKCWITIAIIHTLSMQYESEEGLSANENPISIICM